MALDLQVSQATDDCRRIKSGDYWNTAGVEGALGYAASSYKGCGMAFRFLNVAIPVGATITSAYLSFKASASKSLTVVNSKIRGQNSSNPITFSTQADFDARTWLATIAYWDAIAAWTANQWYNSPDIAAIIQAIINLSGWASGNALVLLWEDWDLRSTQVDNTTRTNWLYEQSSSEAPKLHIEYTPPGAPAGRSVAYIIG
jgi:hypothetical protein